METKGRIIIPLYNHKDFARLAKEAVSTGQTASFIGAIKLIIENETAVLKKVEEGVKPNTETATICKEVRQHIAYLKRQINKIQKAEQRRQVRTPIALDSTLTTGYGRQLEINFGDLDRDTQGRARALDIYDKKLSVGIETDADGYDILLTLSTLLHLHSKNTNNPAAIDYYKGDEYKGGEIVPVEWNGGKVAGAYIKTTLAEMTKIRTGTDKTSKRERQATKAALMKYNEKAYIVQYTEFYTEEVTKKGKAATKTSSRTITTVETLYKAVIAEDKRTRRSVVEIYLKPLFFHQIERSYNLRPIDYLPRVKRAYQRATQNIIVRSVPVSLHYFLTRLIENTGSKEQIYNVKLNELYRLMNDNAAKQRKWGVLQNTLNIYCKVAEDIGLLKSWEIRPSTTDQTEQIAVFRVVKKGEWI